MSRIGGHGDKEPLTKGQNQKIAKLQGEVEDVQGVLKDNINKLLDRDRDLKRLEDISAGLKDGADRFGDVTAALRRKQQQKNRKLNFIVIAVCVGVIATIIIILIILLT